MTSVVVSGCNIDINKCRIDVYKCQICWHFSQWYNLYITKSWLLAMLDGNDKILKRNFLFDFSKCCLRFKISKNKNKKKKTKITNCKSNGWTFYRLNKIKLIGMIEHKSIKVSHFPSRYFSEQLSQTL